MAVLSMARSLCFVEQRLAEPERFTVGMQMCWKYAGPASRTVKCEKYNLKLYLLMHWQPLYNIAEHWYDVLEYAKDISMRAALFITI